MNGYLGVDAETDVFKVISGEEQIIACFLLKKQLRDKDRQKTPVPV